MMPMTWYMHESKYFSAHWVLGKQLWCHSRASCFASFIHSFFLLSILLCVLCTEDTAGKIENDPPHRANADKAKNKSMQISRFNNSRR